MYCHTHLANRMKGLLPFSSEPRHCCINQVYHPLPQLTLPLPPTLSLLRLPLSSFSIHWIFEHQHHCHCQWCQWWSRPFSWSASWCPWIWWLYFRFWIFRWGVIICNSPNLSVCPQTLEWWNGLRAEWTAKENFHAWEIRNETLEWDRGQDVHISGG